MCAQCVVMQLETICDIIIILFYCYLMEWFIFLFYEILVCVLVGDVFKCLSVFWIFIFQTPRQLLIC